MTAAALPSTLVKCLYLFFDLPENESHIRKTIESTEKSSAYNPTEKRTLLQKIFVQVGSIPLGVCEIMVHFVTVIIEHFMACLRANLVDG